MSVIDTITRRTGDFAAGLRRSARRARADGELRLLQRQRRAAVEQLGERTYELIREGRIASPDLGPQVADVESKLMEIDAKVGEIDALRDGDEPEASRDDDVTQSTTRRRGRLGRLLGRS